MNYLHRSFVTVKTQLHCGLICFLLVLLPTLSIGCGLDAFIYLAPIRTGTTVSGTDPLAMRFQFMTTDAENTALAPGYFQGFEVWYRIYNDLETKNTAAQSINSQNSSNPAGVVTFLQGLRYQRLILNNRPIHVVPLIPSAPVDREVIIRLIDFDTTDIARMTVNGANVGIPFRSIGNGKSFSEEILSTDADVQFKSDAGTNNWYVQAFVFAYGFDESYKSLYSSIFDLGAIYIAQP